MSAYVPQNNVTGLTLALSYVASSGSVTLQPGQGGNFTVFPVRISMITAASYGSGAGEIVVEYTATGKSGDTLTGVEVASGFTDRDFNPGDYLEMRWTADYITDLQNPGYLTADFEARIPNSRALQAGTGIAFTDTGPGGTFTLTCTVSAGSASAGGSNNQVQYNSNGSLAGFTAGGDATINTSTGAITVTKTTGTAFAASATTDTTNAANIASGVLATARGGLGVSAASAGVGAVPIGTGSGLALATLTQGANISITNTPGSIQIAAATGNQLAPTGVKTGAYNAAAGDLVLCNASSSYSITLPTEPTNGTQLGVIMTAQTASTDLITIASGGGDVLLATGGPSSLILSYLYQMKIFQYESSIGVWNIIASYDGCTDTGDYLTATLPSGSAVNLSNGATTNITSISLPAGDWDVDGVLVYAPTSVTVTRVIGCSYTTSAGLNTSDALYDSTASLSGSTGWTAVVPKIRYSLSGSSTIYLNTDVSFSAGTLGCWGTIRARRWR